MPENLKICYTIGNKGYIVLLSVLIGGTLITLTTLGLLMMGWQSSKTAAANTDTVQAKALADSCVESALLSLRNGTFTGSGSLNLAGWQCSYSANGTNAPLEIHAQGNVEDIVARVRVDVTTTTPNIQLVSWQDVSDF